MQPAVDRLHLRPLAQKVFRLFYGRLHPADSLVRAVSNGRELWLEARVALRGESSEPATVAWLREHVVAGQCVFDIGANIGEMTLEMASLVGSGGRVVAVEPAPGNLRVLRSHIAANGFASRVDILAAAAGDGSRPDARLIILGDTAETIGTGHNVLAADRQHPHHVASANASLTVPLISVDTYCQAHALHPTALKIDVEGGELAVLKGCRRVLKEDGPAVYFAFHPWGFEDVVAASNEIRAIFTEAGYNLEDAEAAAPFGFREYSALRHR